MIIVLRFYLLLFLGAAWDLLEHIVTTSQYQTMRILGTRIP